MHDIWMACHGPLSCNSGHHVRALAIDIANRGFRTTIVVPERSSNDGSLPRSISLHTYDEVIRQPADGPPSLLHVWTTREGMRMFHRDLCCRFGEHIPYVVHLEDNETLLLQQQMRLSEADVADIRVGLRPLSVPPHLTHPQHGERFMAAAAGVTALLESLVGHLPTAMPTAVFWPGFDPIFARPRPAAGSEVRRRFGIPSDCFLTAYTGNVHDSNVEEVRSLYISIAVINRMGIPVKLIRTGRDYVPLTQHGHEDLAAHVITLGMVSREELADITHAADILVQPGRADDWNAFRVPSKLPDFLASGRPVMLPLVNLGVVLDHGRNAIVLAEATAETIARGLLEWLPQRDRLAALGAAGAEFATDHLTWDNAADKVALLYHRLITANGTNPHATNRLRTPAR
jgi:glycosyltransferase involved in cell wall biosynthesis